MNHLPKVIEIIILEKKQEIELHMKFEKCLNQIKSMKYCVNNDIASSRIISTSKSTSYFMENYGLELWIHKFVKRGKGDVWEIGSYEQITTIYHTKSITDIIFNDYILHSY